MARATRLELAQIAYKAYAEATGPQLEAPAYMADWDDLGDVIQLGYLAAAEAVETALLNPQKNPTTS